MTENKHTHKTITWQSITIDTFVDIISILILFAAIVLTTTAQEKIIEWLFINNIAAQWSTIVVIPFYLVWICAHTFFRQKVYNKYRKEAMDYKALLYREITLTAPILLLAIILLTHIEPTIFGIIFAAIIYILTPVSMMLRKRAKNTTKRKEIFGDVAAALAKGLTYSTLNIIPLVLYTLASTLMFFIIPQFGQSILFVVVIALPIISKQIRAQIHKKYRLAAATIASLVVLTVLSQLAFLSLPVMVAIYIISILIFISVARAYIIASL